MGRRAKQKVYGKKTMKAVLFAMTPLFLGVLLYIWQSANYFHIQRIGLGIAFIGYIVGNLGLAYDIFEQWGK